MIEDKETASMISEMLLRFGKEINNSIIHVQKHSNDEEFKNYRRNMGKIMGEILLNGLNPLYARHPDLKPEGLD